MGKLSNRPTNIHAPIETTGERIPTATGGLGFGRDARSELFLLAATNMVSEQTFHETGAARDDRFEKLIHAVVVEDPAWVAGFVPYLRDTMQMRSASIVLAAEYVHAGGPAGRAVVNAAIKRADEPGEMLGYWRARHGRALPAAIKRGVADACARLYTERNVLKYDGNANAWRFADVIEAVHARPIAPWQSTLFRLLLDQRHHGDGEITFEHPTLHADQFLRLLPEDQRRDALGGDSWLKAGWSWERLSGWLPGGMDAAAWEAVIPQMGYMALLRNLRNFDQAGINAELVATINKKLADPTEVAQSRQFPIRFYSAFKEIGSLRWAAALEQALDLSLANVPALPGRTLILVDLSGSMWAPMSGRSKRERWEIAALFGVAIGKRAENAEVIAYGSSAARMDVLGMPLLRAVEAFDHGLGGTYTFTTLKNAYNGHDRVIILTDEQAHDAGQYDLPSCPIYTFNLAGYKAAHLDSGQRGHYTFGGLTDAAFALLPALEGTRDGHWPFPIVATASEDFDGRAVTR